MTGTKDQWLYQLAASLYDPDKHQHLELEDLAQEGRLAVWQLQQSNANASTKDRRAAAAAAMAAALQPQTTCTDLLPRTLVARVLCSRAPAYTLEVLELALDGLDELQIAKALDTKLRDVRSLLRKARTYFLAYLPLSDDNWIAELEHFLTED